MNKVLKKIKKAQPRKKKFNRGHGSSMITKQLLDSYYLQQQIYRMMINSARRVV